MNEQTLQGLQKYLNQFIRLNDGVLTYREKIGSGHKNTARAKLALMFLRMFDVLPFSLHELEAVDIIFICLVIWHAVILQYLLPGTAGRAYKTFIFDTFFQSYFRVLCAPSPKQDRDDYCQEGCYNKREKRKVSNLDCDFFIKLGHPRPRR